MEEPNFKNRLIEIFADHKWPWSIEYHFFHPREEGVNRFYPVLIIKPDAEWVWARANKLKLKKGLEKYYHVERIIFLPRSYFVRMELREKVFQKPTSCDSTSNMETPVQKIRNPEELTLEQHLHDIFVDLEWPWIVEDLSFELEAYPEGVIYPNILIEPHAEWFWTRKNELKLQKALEKYYRMIWLRFFPGLNRVRMEVKEKVLPKAQQPTLKRETLV